MGGKSVYAVCGVYRIRSVVLRGVGYKEEVFYESNVRHVRASSEAEAAELAGGIFAEAEWEAVRPDWNVVSYRYEYLGVSKVVELNDDGVVWFEYVDDQPLVVWSAAGRLVRGVSGRPVARMGFDEEQDVVLPVAEGDKPVAKVTVPTRKMVKSEAKPLALKESKKKDRV